MPFLAQERENAGDEQGAAEVYLDILSDAGYEGLLSSSGFGRSARREEVVILFSDRI